MVLCCLLGNGHPTSSYDYGSNNDKRMHSSLSYQSPSEFERGLAPELSKKEAA
jgi:hypothetical protein